MSHAPKKLQTTNTIGASTRIADYADRLWEAADMFFNESPLGPDAPEDMRRVQEKMRSRMCGQMTAMEEAISHTKAETLEDALVQVMLAAAYADQVKEMVSTGEVLEAGFRQQDIDRLLYSVVRCLERHTGKPRHRFSEGYMSADNDPWELAPEKATA